MREDPTVSNPQEKTVRDLLREVPESTPSPEFRARLRGSFVNGTIPPGLAGGGHLSGLGRRPDAFSRFGLPIALAAAAGLMILAFLPRTRGPAWEIAGSMGEGEVVVGNDTEPIALAHDLANRLRLGARVRVTGEAQLDLLRPRSLAIQLAPETEITIPPHPGWLRRSSRFHVNFGEARIVTGPDFRGRLLIETPVARIEIVGTTVAVIAAPDSTCLCVLEGSARMTPKEGTAVVVSAGERVSMFGSAKAPIWEEIRPMERMKLEMHRDRAGELWTRPSFR